MNITSHKAYPRYLSSLGLKDYEIEFLLFRDAKRMMQHKWKPHRGL